MATAELLIVEDEGLFALDLQQHLERLGYRVVGVTDSAAEAVGLVRRLRPALVLMDLRIRGAVDGVDAAREIYLRFETPVIFVSGNADEPTLNRATGAEPFGYLVKPVDLRELKAVIETALHRHQAERRVKRLERGLMTTLESISDAVAVVDLEGRVVFLNRAAEKLTGWSAAEALGRSQREVLTRADLAEDAQAELARKVIEQAKVVALGSGAALTRRNGERVAVQGKMSPIVDEAEVTGAVIVVRSEEQGRG